MSEYDPPYAGFALRAHGECPAGTKGCYSTWGGFVSCCPDTSDCYEYPNGAPNSVCCPGKSNCVDLIAETPHCTNSSWTMFNQFCCLDGQKGFWTSEKGHNGSVGCSDGDPDSNLRTLINPSEQTFFSSSPTPSPTSTPSSKPTDAASPTPNPESPSEGSSTNTGAIAGGVVGGVVGVALIIAAIIFLLRRRRKNGAQPDGSNAPPGFQPVPTGVFAEAPVKQYPGDDGPRELDNTAVKPYELHGETRPSELP